MSWWEYAEYHDEPGLDQRDRDYAWTERTCVARAMRIDRSGENRFYVAPAVDGTWYAWGEWHGCIDNPIPGDRRTIIRDVADDATYTFANGGAFFSSPDHAMAAIHRWISRDVAVEFRSVESAVAS